jgi:preprotein translocase subunit SecE
MNRALRRQQVKEKPGRSSSARAMPRTGPAPRASGGAQASRGSILRPRFATDIISELRKVIWPSRDDVFHLTVVIVIVTIIIGAVLGGIDFAFGKLVDEYLLR